MAKTASKRILGLDIVRSLAILLVVYGHGALLLPPNLAPPYLLPSTLIDGVNIFFVLSGFLIGNILLKTITTTDFGFKDLLRFWIKRWFRTLPAYFLVLGLVVLLISIFKDGLIITMDGFTPKLFYFSQNLFDQNFPLFFPEGWSLAVEEWFYLLFPLACFLALKFFHNKNKAFLIPALFFLIVPVFIRFIGFYYQINTDDWDMHYRKIVIFRLDSLMYGILGAYFFTFYQNYWLKFKNISLIFALILLIFSVIFLPSTPDNNPTYLTIIKPILESIIVLLILPFFSQIKTLKFHPLARFFTFISLISYSLYLISYTLVQKILLTEILYKLNLRESTNPSLSFFTYPSYWLITILLSSLLYKFFEKPVTNLRDKIKI